MGSASSKGGLPKKPEKLGFAACKPLAIGDGRFGATSTGTRGGEVFSIKEILFLPNLLTPKPVAEEYAMKRKAAASDVLVLAATLPFDRGFSPLHEHFLEKNGANLVYKHVPGETLVTWVERNRPPKQNMQYEQRVGNIVIQLLTSISFLHGKGICHWNINPSNIIISEGGKVTLLEACIAEGFEWRLRVEGTGENGRQLRSYLAPELLASSDTTSIPYTSQCDMYSIGAVVAFAFSGKDLFSPVQSDILGLGTLDKKLFRKSFMVVIKGLWTSMSASASDFMCRLLQFDPTVRSDATQALLLPWCKQLQGTSSIEPNLFAELEFHLSFSTLLPTALMAR
jgi:serine/threonine protein kinase